MRYRVRVWELRRHLVEYTVEARDSTEAWERAENQEFIDEHEIKIEDARDVKVASPPETDEVQR